MTNPVIPADMPRTACSCHNCTAGCKSMPGCLIPGDLERIQDFIGDKSGNFVLEHFRVSDGAKVGKKIGDTTYVFSVPSLVPAQRPDGRCVFLDAQDRCSIHSVSPFGCGYCDMHIPKDEGDRRMQFCVATQIADHQQGGPYSKWCELLANLKLQAAPLLERRAAMEKLLHE